MKIDKNIKWLNMTGIGPTAWNHGGQPMGICSMHHHHEEHVTKKTGLRDPPADPEHDRRDESPS